MQDIARVYFLIIELVHWSKLGASTRDFWRRKWKPTPALLPGKCHGWRSLVGYSPWGRKESDMTEQLHFTSLHERFWGCPGGAGGKEFTCRCRILQEMRVQFLGWEDPLEEKMATHSNNLAWRIPWREKPGGPQSMSPQSQTGLSAHFPLPWEILI